MSRGGGGGELKPRCAYKTRDGAPCKGRAIGSNQGCWNHDSDFEMLRRRNARRGGKQGGRGRPSTGSADLLRLQSRFEDLADKVLAGVVDKADAAVACQCLNGARSAILGIARIKETEEFELRLSELERHRGLS